MCHLENDEREPITAGAISIVAMTLVAGRARDVGPSRSSTSMSCADSAYASGAAPGAALTRPVAVDADVATDADERSKSVGDVAAQVDHARLDLAALTAHRPCRVRGR